MQLTKLKFNPENPRRISPDQLDKLVKSIESLPKMMVLRPIVYDPATMHVLGGNQRLAALRKMGMKEIPDNWTKSTDDMTDKEKREFVLRDNVQAGEWDYSVLDESFADFDLDDIGIDLPEGFDSEPGEVTEDDYEQPAQVETDIVLGDLFSLRKDGKEIHRLLCGDATKKEDVERLMGGEKADMVFTDPPYGISVVGKNGSIGKGVITKAGKYNPVTNDDQDYDPAHLFGFSCDVFVWGANYFSDKLPRGQWFVWDKGRPEGTTYSDAELAWSNLTGIAVKTYRCVWNGMIREGESGKRTHPTQKPIKLCSDILSDITPDDAHILDIFLGSGSTMVACHQLDRKCYGMEIEPTYCQVTLDRMRKLDPDIEVVKVD